VVVPYAPALVIAGIATSIGIVVGSIGPWLQVFAFSASGLDLDGWGTATLTLGAAAVIALATERELLRARSDIQWAVPLAWSVFIAGVACLAVAVVNLVRFVSASTEILGASIDVGVGWGLWVVAACSALLSLIGAIVAMQAGKANNQAGWAWVGIIGSATIVFCTIAYIWATGMRSDDDATLFRFVEYLQH